MHAATKPTAAPGAHAIEQEYARKQSRNSDQPPLWSARRFHQVRGSHKSTPPFRRNRDRRLGGILSEQGTPHIKMSKKLPPGPTRVSFDSAESNEDIEVVMDWLRDNRINVTSARLSRCSRSIPPPRDRETGL